MSVENKQVRGDASVSRNVNAGGNARVQGNMHVGHNLRVDGAVEARNIKAANKGLFWDEAQLNARYPQPEEGWFAGVGSSSPFVVYIARDGEWQRTNGTFSVDVDMDSYNNRIDDLESQVAELIEIILSGGGGNVVNVRVSVEGHGSVTGSGLYQIGNSVTLTATAENGYHFVEWQDAEGNTIAGAGATYTFEATESVTLKAVFAVSYFTVTATPNDSELGSVTLVADNEETQDGYNYGTQITLTATPKPNHNPTAYFVAWKENGVVVSRDAEYQFGLTKDVVLVAEFEEVAIIVTDTDESSTGTGTIDVTIRRGDDVVTSNNDIRIGDIITLTATGTSRNPTAMVDGSGNPIPAAIDTATKAMTYTFTYTGSEPLTYKVKFDGDAVIVQRTIKVQANNANYGDVHIEENGVSVGTQKEIPEDTEVSLVATPKTGFIFDTENGWEKGADRIGGNESTIQIIVSDTTAGTYTAYFKHAGEPDFYFGVFDTPTNNPVLDNINDDAELTKGWLTDNVKAQITLPPGKTFVVLYRSSVVPTECKITDDIGPGTLDLDSQQSFYATTKTLNNVAYTAREFYGGNTGSGEWSVEITFAANNNSQE